MQFKKKDSKIFLTGLQMQDKVTKEVWRDSCLATHWVHGDVAGT